MDTYLCKHCGARIDETMQICPKCGALNLINSEVLSEEIKKATYLQKELKKFSSGVLLISLIIGILLFIANIAMLFAAEYTKIIAFIGAVGGAIGFVFSIIGLVKNEPVNKAVGISICTSAWCLFMQIFFIF